MVALCRLWKIFESIYPLSMFSFHSLAGAEIHWLCAILVSYFHRFHAMTIVYFLYNLKKQDVKFPMSLDVFELCTEELQQKLLPVRTKFKEVEDKKVEEAAVKLRYLRCPCKLTSYWLFEIGWSVNQSLSWLISLLVANLQAHHWVSQSESHSVTQSLRHSVC